MLRTRTLRNTVYKSYLRVRKFDNSSKNAIIIPFDISDQFIKRITKNRDYHEEQRTKLETFWSKENLPSEVIYR